MSVFSKEEDPLGYQQLALDRSLLHCDCGKIARSFCGVMVRLDGQLHLHHPQPCRLPVCDSNGGHCLTHRHAPGTMGYLPPANEVRFEARKFAGKGAWDSLVAFWRNTFWSAEHTAEWVYQRHLDVNCRPPVPLPQNFVVLFSETGRRLRRRLLKAKSYRAQWEDLDERIAEETT